MPRSTFSRATHGLGSLAPNAVPPKPHGRGNLPLAERRARVDSLVVEILRLLERPYCVKEIMRSLDAYETEVKLAITRLIKQGDIVVVPKPLHYPGRYASARFYVKKGNP